ncbi:MAG: hypothetical protein CL610_21700 [Anaerolineaceae bacterium]|nr:hypothetical protein [Anaerolineaceae bacterium]
MQDTRRLATELLQLLPDLKNMLIRKFDGHERQLTLIQLGALGFFLNEPRTISELATARQISLQTASEMVGNLADQGLVERIRSVDDRRKWMVQVTDTGTTTFHQENTLVADIVTSQLTRLSDDEVAALHIALPALHRIFSEGDHSQS